MLLEPERSPYDVNFSIAGIPVRIHPLFWLGGVASGATGSGGALELLMWIGVLFVSILIHEFGHAIAMRYFGEMPRVVLYLMGGLAIHDGNSWMRGSSSRSRSPMSQIIISAAGPFAGFAFALVIIGVIFAMGGRVLFGVPSLERPVAWMIAGISNRNLLGLLWDLLYVNIFWGLINLLPVYPLDGGQIARQFLMMKDPMNGTAKSLQLSFVVGVVIAVVGYFVWQQMFLAMLFGYLAYSSYQTLQHLGGGRGQSW